MEKNSDALHCFFPILNYMYLYIQVILKKILTPFKALYKPILTVTVELLLLVKVHQSANLIRIRSPL